MQRRNGPWSPGASLDLVITRSKPQLKRAVRIYGRDGIIKRGWDLASFVRFTSSNCAHRFGIYGRKGTIRVGADGDLVVIDPQASWTVRSEDLFYKQRWSALEGETLSGRIDHTVVRGRVVYDSGEIKVESGYGEFVMPERQAAASEARQREAMTV